MPVLSVTAPFIARIDTERFLELFASIGCRSSQFFRDGSREIRPDDALRIAQSAELPFDSIHGRFGEAYDPSSPETERRLRTLQDYEHEGEIAASVGGPMVVVHPSWRASRDEDAPRAGAAGIDSRRLQSLLGSFEALAEMGEEMGVTYLIENLPPAYWIGFDAPRLAEWIRRVDSTALRLCFDTGHAHMAADRCGEVGVQLEQCLDVVSYVHAHDNNAVEDSHRFPGEGTINWKGVASALEDAPPDLIVMLETFHDPLDEIERRVESGLAERMAELLGLS